MTILRDKTLDSMRRYLERNREVINAKRRADYAANRERKLAQKKAYYDRSYFKVYASQRMTQAKRKKRAPPWLSEEHANAILEFYIESARISEETGVKHHVDHIVPLLGKKVSGLHVPWNLQIIPGDENIRKGNRHTA